jgi:hypothetical protein
MAYDQALALCLPLALNLAASKLVLQKFCVYADGDRVFDTAGILGRDLQKLADFAAEWLSPIGLQKNAMV